MQKDDFLSSVNERDIDLLLLEEASVNPEFQSWLIMRVWGEPVEYSNFEAYHSVLSLGRESDLIFRFIDARNSTRHIAILVENKVDAVHQPDQGKGYLARGNEGIKTGDWTEFITCIIAPEQYLAKPETREHPYGEHISYEELLAFFWSRRARDERNAYRFQVLLKAIDKSRRHNLSEASEPLTAFVSDYYHYVQQHMPYMSMPMPKSRSAASTWIEFRPNVYPSYLRLYHQLSGHVKAFWSGAADRFEDMKQVITPLLQLGMQFEVAGKSVALVLAVPKIDALSHGFVQEQANVSLALEAVRRIDKVIRDYEGLEQTP